MDTLCCIYPIYIESFGVMGALGRETMIYARRYTNMLIWTHPPLYVNQFYDNSDKGNNYKCQN